MVGWKDVPHSRGNIVLNYYVIAVNMYLKIKKNDYLISCNISPPVPPPIVTTIAAPSQVVIAGSNLTLTCKIQLDPSVDSTVMVNNTWIAPGGATLSGSNPSWTGSSYQSTLMLTSLGTGNAGNYICGALVTPTSTQYSTGPMGRNTSILGTFVCFYKALG